MLLWMLFPLEQFLEELFECVPIFLVYLLPSASENLKFSKRVCSDFPVSYLEHQKR